MAPPLERPLLAKCLFLLRKAVKYNSRSCFSTHKQVQKKQKKYSNTVILPKTAFPLRLDGKKRTQTDEFVLQNCGFNTLYRWQRENITGKEFILHDGPPYANGMPHIGHAINKVLKDVTIRHKLLQGYKIHYISGWDCHGLPIELKAIKDETGSENKLTPVEIRTKARKFAEEAIVKQKAVFKSWGIMTDWDETYCTFNKEYMKNEFRKFYKMYELGIIFRDLKPIFWSPSSRTALAEAELEYNPSHRSTALYVRLQLDRMPDVIRSHISSSEHVFAIIWTTTPWTLPSNQAVCFNPKLEYSLVTVGNSSSEKFIVASELVETIQQKLERPLKQVTTFSGDSLHEVSYRHPFVKNKMLPFLESSHVSTTKGTGLVHSSPAHGPEDFVVALKHNIPVECMVDENGCYTSDAVPELQGMSVLSDGATKVLSMLAHDIIHTEDYIHSYPYDWRTKQPVILRASHQWFINTNAIKDKALEKLETIKVVPKKSTATHMGQGLATQVEQRPYWCISRQRVWGTPIPVMFSKTDGRIITDRSLIEQLCKALDKHGTDFWWTTSISEIVSPEWLSQHNITADELQKSQDIFDIWLDSGLSWSSVLGDEQVADVYLEGFDQFNGWFQSSLMTSIALRNEAPYKTLFVHGFAVDENERKMSKSLGNVIDPQDIIFGRDDSVKMPAYGLDTLRWWVAGHSSQYSKVPISKNVLEECWNSVHKIRIVLRFILGSLDGFVPERDIYEVDTRSEQFYVLDQYMLHGLYELHSKVEELYDAYEYNNVCGKLMNFIVNDVSALYCHLVKDRLYCDRRDSSQRQSAQIVLYHILETVVRLIAPITPILAEEIYHYHPCRREGEFLFRSGIVKPSLSWYQPDVANVTSAILNLKQDAHNKACGKNTLEFEARINVPHNMVETVQMFQKDEHSFVSQLCEVLQVSSVVILPESPDGDEFHVQMVPSPYHLCERCRHYCSQVSGEPCDRCNNVLQSLSS